MIYIMFVLISYGSSGNPRSAATSFTYEFKSKADCEAAIPIMKRRLVDDPSWQHFKGFCLETKK